MKKLVILTLTAGSMFLAGCRTAAPVTNWEYTVVRDPIGMDNEVNRMARNGWIVVSFSVADDLNKQPNAYYLMKRPKQ